MSASTRISFPPGVCEQWWGDVVMQMDRGAGTRAFVDAVATLLCSLLLGLFLVLGNDGTATTHILGVVAGLVVPTLAAGSITRRRPRVSTAADRITLLRGVLAGGCATLVILGLVSGSDLRTWPLFLLALPAVLLDGVDGWVARRTATASPAGGRLDMETDAALLVILSLALAPTLGWWVMAIGAMRYLFWAAAWWRPALGGRLRFSQFRRVVAGTQGCVLVGCLPPVVPPLTASIAAALALALLTVSFGKDVATLERSRWSMQRSVEASSRSTPSG